MNGNKKYREEKNNKKNLTFKIEQEKKTRTEREREREWKKTRYRHNRGEKTNKYRRKNREEKP